MPTQRIPARVVAIMASILASGFWGLSPKNAVTKAIAIADLVNDRVDDRGAVVDVRVIERE